MVPVPTAITRSDLWFHDGTIVLQADDTQFRVYRGALEDHSERFQDLFHDEADVFDGETVEGSPLVIVPGDSARDMEHFLKALFKPTYFYGVVEKPAYLIMAVLRLGKKYGVAGLYNDALAILHQELPTTLEGYDKRPEDIQYTLSARIAMVNLLAELKLKKFLPFALYNVVQKLELRALLQHPQLVPQLSQICVLGREALRDAMFVHTYSWTSGTFAGSRRCESPLECEAQRHIVMSVWMDPHMILMPWDRQTFAPQLCQYCAKVCKKAHNDGRRHVWENLPLYFGMEPWNELFLAQ